MEWRGDLTGLTGEALRLEMHKPEKSLQDPGNPPNLPPCPFCGKHVVPGLSQAKDYIVYWSHPENNPNTPHNERCPMSGRTIGAKVIERFWITPVSQMTRELYYTLKGGVPVFNRDGIGTPAPLEFVNECFDYVCANGDLPNVTGR